MKNVFVIQWKNKVNGRAGKGTKQFNRQEAQALCEELNAEYPDILHEPLSAPEAPLEPTPAEEVSAGYNHSKRESQEPELVGG